MYSTLFRLVFIVTLFNITACQSDTSTTATETTTAEEKPLVVKDPATRIDNLIVAMDVVENAVNVKKTFDLGDVTYRLQGTYLDSTLIRVVANLQSEYYLDSKTWYLQNSLPIYMRRFLNNRDCGTSEENCLQETILYYDNGQIFKALQRERKINTTTEQAAFAGESATPFNTNSDSLTAATQKELALYIKKIKEQ